MKDGIRISKKMTVSKRTDFNNFKRNYPIKGEALYQLIFERHSDKIKLSGEKYAIKNLQIIFTATFKMVPKIGFQAMSLRDLSSETGLSMGALYSSISYKENIAIIVRDVVELVCNGLIADITSSNEEPLVALERMLREFLYASIILQPWFYFLYFETRSLPLVDQEASKSIELNLIDNFEDLIGQCGGIDSQLNLKARDLASMLLAMSQEYYLKPWKYKHTTQSIESYGNNCLAMAKFSLADK